MSERQKEVKGVILGVVIGQDGGLIWGPWDQKHTWPPPDGDVLWAAGGTAMDFAIVST